MDLLRYYERFNHWFGRAIDKLKIKSCSIALIVGFFLLTFWFGVSGFFLIGGVFYSIYYFIRWLCYLIFKTPMPKKKVANGYEYEEQVARSLRRKGYRNVQVTPKSGDYGADIIATDPHGNRVCIQCKFYRNSVGLAAVQEVVTAKAKYNCNKAAVYTNSHFTKQAKELAIVNDVDLFEFYEAIFD